MSVRVSRSVSALLLLASACTPPARTDWSEARAIGPAGSASAAPMLAVGPTGQIALAAVTAEGQLYVTAGADTRLLRDTLGFIEAHGEAPPKLAHGTDGSLYVLYVVAKQIPGVVWPVSSLRVARSRDGGRSFDPPVTVTRDSTFGAFNFHALHVAGDGSVYVGFLRDHEGKSAAYIARSSDEAQSWGPAVRIEPGEACPCCRVAISSTRDGRVFASWRTVLPGDVRDIVLAQSGDRGDHWSSPERVHRDDWVFRGCPHAGPALVADSAGTLHVGWWTAAERRGGVYYAQSKDGGSSFTPPVVIDAQREPRPSHVQVAVAPSGLIVVTWERFEGSIAQIHARVSRDAGRSFEPATVLSSGARSAGFPVVALTADSVLIAWAEEDPAAIEHRAAEHEAAVKEGKPVPLATAENARVLMRSAPLR
jgi:hypothetical protein